MIGKFVDLFFGCSHRRLTFPMTSGRDKHEAATRETYVACLGCGREFTYDWHRMKVISTRKGYQLAPRPERVQQNIAC